MDILYMAMESGNWVLQLCNELCELGHNVTCMIQGIDEYDKTNPITPHKNMEVFYIPYQEFGNPLAFKQKHMQKLIGKNFDIVFGSHVVISATLRMVAETLSKPWGLMILDIPSDLMITQRFRMKQWLTYFDNIKPADVMIFNTKISRDEYYKYTNQFFPNECVITYGIPTPEETFKSGMDIKGDYVISICRIVRNKNCNLIPSALGLINGIKKYVMIGSIEDKNEFAYIKKLCKINKIELEHYYNITEKEKFELIKNSAMLIYPQKTPYIGGLSPWEGMYIGKPVLVPKLKVMNDLYKENVTYFENNDAISLAREISFINQVRPELTKSLKEKAAEFSKEEGSFKNMATKISNVLEKTIESRRQ